MVKITGIVQSEVRSDGTIEMIARVPAANEWTARRKARKKALLEAGYSPTIPSQRRNDIDIQTSNIQRIENSLLRELYEVEVKIVNAGEYLSSE